MTNNKQSVPQALSGWTLLLVLALIAIVCVVLRLLPHPPNFTPVGAAALFAGTVLLRQRAGAMLLIAGIMVCGDALIGFYDLRLMLAVYVALAVPVLFGRLIRQGRWRYPSIAAGSLAAAVVFYLASNLAVFAFSPWYARSASGLIDCYVAAIPFFKYTLAGNLFWSLVFFGLYDASRLLAPTMQRVGLSRRAALTD